MTNKDMDFFHTATTKICGSLDADRMLSRCKTFLNQYFPVDRMVMGFFDPEKRALHNVSRASDMQEPFDELVYVPEEVAECIRIEHTHEDVTIKTWSNFPPAVYQWWKSMGMVDGSYMPMNLSLDGVYIGFVTVFSRNIDRYTHEHAQLFSMLSSPFAVALSNLLQHRELERLKDMLKANNQDLQQRLRGWVSDEIIGAASGLKEVMTKVRKVAPLSSQVMLLGETGVGKEVIANAIHQSSTRANRPFITVNCGAIPENLMDSELFGHERGAFTGATEMKQGRFERAHQGTIFLDEIGELPLNAQVRLLRVIQNREIERIGGVKTIPVDIRIIAATHRNLEQMVAEGEFRQDLWFRLYVFPIIIPPLRKRTQDIPELVRYFIQKKAIEMKFKYLPTPVPGFMEFFQKNVWKGNIRELENTVERVMIRHMGAPESSPLSLDDLKDEDLQISAPPLPLDLPLASLDTAMADHIRTVMAHTRGKIKGDDGAAAILGIHPSTLRGRMKKLGIPFGKSEKC